jgi:hypothetical protein
MRSLGFLLAVLLAGCAQMGAPPGGPADDAPPEIVALTPAADSTGVRPPYTIEITFSEKMDKRSVERTLGLFPEPSWVRMEWRERTLLVDTDRASGETPDSGGTAVVTVSGRAEDRHGNAMKNPFAFAYTSRESLPGGEASGTIEGLARAAGAPPATVRALHAPAADSPTPRILLETEASLDGSFRIRPLPTGAGPILLFAYQDENESGGPDFDEELYGYSDTIHLSPEAPAADSIHIALVRFDTPCSLEGTASDAGSTDSLFLIIEAAADTTAETVFAEPDSAGHYAVTGLAPGANRVRLLRGDPDAAAAEGNGAATSILVERSLTLRPGEKRLGFDLPERLPEPQVTP